MTTANARTFTCDHCLLPVAEKEVVVGDFPGGGRVFCCHACRAIYRMITEEGLGDFYKKRDWKAPGIPETLRGEERSQSELPAQEPDSLAPFIHGWIAARETDSVSEAQMALGRLAECARFWKPATRPRGQP